MSVNKVILIGRLGKDVELRYANNGKAVANFSMAMGEQWTDRDGKKQEKTEWANIVCWDKQAENCSKYIFKGSQVYVEGKLQTRSYDDKSGTKRYVTEVVAQQVKFLDSRKQEQPGGDVGAGAPPLDDDQIPF